MLQKLILRALLILRSAASRIVSWTERTETVMLTAGADKPLPSSGGAPEHWLRYIREHMESDAQTFDMKAVSPSPSFDLSPDFALTLSGSTDDPTSTDRMRSEDKPQADVPREPPLSAREIWLHAIRQLTVPEAQSAETRQDADKPDSMLTEAWEEPAVHAVQQASPAAQEKQPIAGVRRNSWRVEHVRPSFESSKRVDTGESSDFLVTEPVRAASTPSLTPAQTRVDPTNARSSEHSDPPQNQHAVPGDLLAPPSSGAAAMNLGAQTWRGRLAASQTSPHHARTSTAEVQHHHPEGVIDQAANISEDVSRKSQAPLPNRVVSGSEGTEKANTPFQTAIHQPHPTLPILNGDTWEASARSSPIPSEPQYSGFSDHWVELPEFSDDGGEPQHEAESLKAKYQRRLDSEQLAANTLWNAQHS